jgi:Reverse transcriptase (RNA-dependent DNA polymerase)
MPRASPRVSEALKFAVHHFARFSDTDVFPAPVEKYIFYDQTEEALKLVERLHADFAEEISRNPPLADKELTVAGYTGFRPGTQIDPLWHVYLLGLCIYIAPHIESARIPTDKHCVFSYRYSPDTTAWTLFDKTLGWAAFKAASLGQAQRCKFVLKCDIADFYTRIYHHRLDNALQAATSHKETASRIIKILSSIAGTSSYGLPIGGDASRLLSELLLNRVDRLLLSSGIQFIRFVDDYRIFANSREHAQECLIRLSKYLLENEGLSLAKHKTFILPSDEYLRSLAILESSTDPDVAKDYYRLRNIRVHYDPYSQTAEQDWAKIKNELRQVDVPGLLGRELHKSRLDESTTRTLIKSVRFLSPPLQDKAIESILDGLQVLYPIFPSVMSILRILLPELSQPSKRRVFEVLRSTIENQSFTTQVVGNLCHALRIVAEDPSEEAELVLSRVYLSTESAMVKRDIILLMARRRAMYWISDKKNRFTAMPAPERRALYIASYLLGDEGKHWRKSVSKSLGPLDVLAGKWIAQRKQDDDAWVLPL